MRKSAAGLACTLALAYASGPAHANTEASAAHAQAMNDIAATPPCCDGGGGEWQGYEPNFSAEELEQMLRQSKIEEAQSQRKHEARMASDPEYRSFFDGFWNFRPAPENTPGQHCAARFYREGSGMMIFGPAQGSPSAYLALYGPGVPAPKSARKITVQLFQTGEERQTVEVFNLPMAGTGGNGMLLMAVPNAELFLNGMLDKHRFEVLDRKRRDVLYILEWTGGLAARDKLRSCIDART